MPFTFTEYKGNDLVSFESHTIRDDGMVVVKELGSFGKGKATALGIMTNNGLSAEKAKQAFTSLVNKGWRFNDVPAEELIDGATALVGETVEEDVAEAA